MELIIAIVLFVAIVAAWLFLPSAPTEAAASHGAATSPTKASPTA